jgi:transposase-like protein
MKKKNTAAGGGIKRCKYDASFRQEVLRMVLNGRPVSEVAHSLGIGENIIYRWKSSANQQKQSDRLPVPGAWGRPIFEFVTH